MKIKYQENKQINHHEVHIAFHPTNKETIHLVLKTIENSLGEIRVFDEYYNYYSLTIMSIYYIEIIEHRVFIYTKNSVYRKNDTIKSLKEQLKNYGFFQINVRTLVNRYHVIRYKIGKDCRRIIELDNQESLIVNRNYRNELKENMEQTIKKYK